MYKLRIIVFYLKTYSEAKRMICTCQEKDTNSSAIGSIDGLLSSEPSQNTSYGPGDVSCRKFGMVATLNSQQIISVCPAKNALGFTTISHSNK